jgi:hypothetical protein
MRRRARVPPALRAGGLAAVAPAVLTGGGRGAARDRSVRRGRVGPPPGGRGPLAGGMLRFPLAVEPEEDGGEAPLTPPSTGAGGDGGRSDRRGLALVLALGIR